MSQFILAGVYVVLASSGKLLISLSKELDASQYTYVPVTVVAMSELIKLVVCCLLSVHQRRKDPASVTFSWRRSVHFMVPGLFYFMDNSINYYVLLRFNPAVATLLGNFVVLTTAVLFRLVLRRRLSAVQWLSLVILLLGVLTSQAQHQRDTPVDHKVVLHHIHGHGSVTGVGSGGVGLLAGAGGEPTAAGWANSSSAAAANGTDTPPPGWECVDEGPAAGAGSSSLQFSWGHLLVLVQCLCASFANIYNEKIFKKDFSDSIYFQNAQLYFFGLLFNLAACLAFGNLDRIRDNGFFGGWNLYTVAAMFASALLGLSVSMILKFADNMVHVLAQSVAQVAVISLTIPLFHFRPSLEFFLGSLTLLGAVMIYNLEASARKKADAAASAHADDGAGAAKDAVARCDEDGGVGGGSGMSWLADANTDAGGGFGAGDDRDDDPSADLSDAEGGGAASIALQSRRHRSVSARHHEFEPLV